MKTLLVYYSHNDQVVSSAKRLVELLRRHGMEVQANDLSKQEIDVLAHYDRVIVISDLAFGKLSGNMRSYLVHNAQELLIKQVYLLIHSWQNQDDFARSLSGQVSAPLLQHAHTLQLGLNVNYQHLSPWDKLRWNLAGHKVHTPFHNDQLDQAATLVTK